MRIQHKVVERKNHKVSKHKNEEQTKQRYPPTNQLDVDHFQPETAVTEVGWLPRTAEVYSGTPFMRVAGVRLDEEDELVSSSRDEWAERRESMAIAPWERGESLRVEE